MASVKSRDNTAETVPAAGAGSAGDNEVRLTGRVTSGPEVRTLPSGDEIVVFRISVPRAQTPMTRGSRQGVDWVDCVAFGAGVRRALRRRAVGDVVRVEGALRRRFYRSGGAASTRLEVEALRVTRR